MHDKHEKERRRIKNIHRIEPDQLRNSRNVSVRVSSHCTIHYSLLPGCTQKFLVFLNLGLCRQNNVALLSKCHRCCCCCSYCFGHFNDISFFAIRFSSCAMFVVDWLEGALSLVSCRVLLLTYMHAAADATVDADVDTDLGTSFAFLQW